MAEPRRRSGTILVTGFGGFPGSPRNPTERIVAALARDVPRFRRLGIELRCAVLPVEYGGLGDRLDALAREHRPDSWLMLGVAGRRRRLCIETLARNRAAPVRPDAAGRRPGQLLLRGGPTLARSTLPCRAMLARLVEAGLPVQLSRDAGDYLCNAALFMALAGELAPAVGFLHVPMPTARQTRRSASPSPVTPEALLRAVRLVALVLGANHDASKR